MRNFGFARPGRVRTAALAVAAAVVVGGVVVIGADDGNPAHDVRLLSGAAWFSSAKVGQVTLLDGTTAEVAAQVRVAAAGKSIEVVQQGSAAYAVDQTEGTVRRIDGATFEVSPSESPIPDAHAGLMVVPSEKALYTLDSRRGILATTDPRTLVRRGELLSLASQLSAGTATVDDAGTLWTVDTATGDLSRVAGESQTVRRQVVQPGRSVMTVANGHPVVVDTVGRKAITVDRDSGRVTGTLDLNLRTDDTVQVSGSPHSERLYVVVGRGSLNICDLAAGNCDKAIPLAADSEFGAAVEAGDRLFVPDYTAGQVWIVDLAQSKVVAKPKVLTAGGKFQLITRDGIVFYNDVNSAEAGVIRFDGTVTQIAKYDRQNPDKGITVPSSGTGQQATQQTGQQTSSPHPRTTKPSQPNPTNTQQPNPNDSPPNPDPNTPPPDPGENDALKIAASKATPTVDEVVTFQVTSSTGATMTDIEWTFGDGDKGGGQTTSHKWAAARANPYNVAVTATVNGKQIAASVSVTVTPEPTVKLTVTNNGGGTITGDGGINCATAICEYNLKPKTRVTLTANPGPDHELGNWGDACAGTTNTCDVTVDVPKKVTYTFKVEAPIEITVFIGGGITFDHSGTISLNGQPCSKECKYTIKRNQDVTLSKAAVGENYTTGLWKNGCPNDAHSCTIHWDKSTTVSSTFPRKFFILRVLTPVRGGRVVGSHGINCPGVCEANFDKNEPVTVTAEPDAGKKFKTWGAGPPCGGFGAVCTPTFREETNLLSPAFE